MDKYLSLLSGVLKIEPEALKTKIESEEGYKEIEGKVKGLNIFTPEALTTRDKKLKADHVTELSEAVGRNEVPNVLYNSIKGNVMAQLDKDLAAKLKIDSYSDHNDLIGKIQTMDSSGNVDEKVKTEVAEYRAKIDELNKKLEEKEGEFSKFKTGEILNRTKAEILEKYPYAGKSDEEKAAQREILSAFIDSKFKFGTHEDKAALLDENGKPIKDNALNVINPYDHIVKEMKSFVPQDNGADPGAGNGAPRSDGGKKMTTDQFVKEMSEKGATSEEMSREHAIRVKNGLIED